MNMCSPEIPQPNKLPPTPTGQSKREDITPELKAAPKEELESTKSHLEQIRRAVHEFYHAKGRYHSQIAAARLFELVGLPSQYPPTSLQERKRSQ